jgi:hypothetical protein
MVYDGGAEMTVARTVSMATLLGLVAWAVSARRRRYAEGRA